MPFSSSELTHYQRHLILPGFGIEAQEKLKKFSVLVIGAGGLGCPVLLYLAASGIGKIGIIDNDLVSESNLHRQVLFGISDIGKPKSEIAAKRLADNNPNIILETITQFLSKENALDIVKNYDLVIDGSDNFPTRYLANDACVILNKPLVSGSIFTYEGQISVFNYKNGPTYRCLFPEPPSADEMPNCAEIGVLGVLPGIIGTLMATETIKIAAEIGETLSGKLLVYDALQMSFHTIQFAANPENQKITTLGNYDFSCETALRKEISAQEFKNKRSDFVLIDVREPNEYAAFNIGGINIPLSRLENLYSEIPTDVTVVIHCQAGGRSAKAIRLLEDKYGFTNLINLANGLKEW
jgi:molybdopterin/thiamine biosynthesis adenylyltransferase/rhodanese-related sulfurtransferase